MLFFRNSLYPFYLPLVCLISLPSFALAWTKQSSTPPLSEETRIGYGLYAGEHAIYLANRQAIWTKTSGRWKKLHWGTDPIKTLLVAPNQEGWWIQTDRGLAGNWLPNAKIEHIRLRRPTTFSSRSGQTILLLDSKSLYSLDPFQTKPQRIGSLSNSVSETTFVGDQAWIIQNGQARSVAGAQSYPADSMASCGSMLALGLDGRWQIKNDQSVRPVIGTWSNTACVGNEHFLFWRDQQWQVVDSGGSKHLAGLFPAPPWTATGVVHGNEFRIAMLGGSGIFVDIQLLNSSLSKQLSGPVLPLQHILALVDSAMDDGFGSPSAWQRRSRLAGLLPTVRVQGGLGYDRNQDKQIEPLHTISSAEQLAIIGPDITTNGEDQGQDWDIGLSLTWQLDRLIFGEEELATRRLWKDWLREKERRIHLAGQHWQTLMDPQASAADQAYSRGILHWLTGGTDPMLLSGETP